MRYSTTQATTAQDSWFLVHAGALLAYAATDQDFATSFAYHVQSRNWAQAISVTDTSAMPYVQPTSQTTATATAAWLLNSLDQSSGATHTKGALATWARDYEDPKDLIIGIVGLAIMGPTLGILNRKKERSHMHVIINDTWAETHNKKQVAALVQTMSQRVLAHELRLAGGNVYQLHPDTAAWLLEDPLTKLHVTSKAELAALQKAAQKEQLSYEAKPDVAIAISPTVSETFVTQFAVSDIE